MNKANRPLSPHLQIYRPQFSSVSSILHRMTGAFLVLGGIVFVWWLMAAATGPDAFARANNCLGSFLGQIALFGWVWAGFYHLVNGIRHLLWDAGHGFDKDESNRTARIVIIGSVLLTFSFWLIMTGRG